MLNETEKVKEKRKKKSERILRYYRSRSEKTILLKKILIRMN